MKLKLALLFVFSLLIATATSHGGLVVRSNDFNEDTQGFTLTPNTGTVERTGPESTFSEVAGGSSMKLTVDASTGFPRLDTFVPGDNGINTTFIDPTKPLRISFDFMQALKSSNSTFLLYDQDGSTRGITMQMRRQDTNEGLWVIQNGPTPTETGVVLDLDTWYHFELIVDPENNAGEDTFQLIVWSASGTILNESFTFRSNLNRYSLARWTFGFNDIGSEFYIDNIIIESDPDTIVPPDLAPDTWAGYDLANENGDVDTMGWLGWINVSNGDWVWVYDLDHWIYLPESLVTDTGAWLFVPSL